MVWRHPQGGGGGRRRNCETQGGGGAARYLSATSPGRRRGKSPCPEDPREEEGVLRYRSGGILREEEGGCRLNPDPREEEWVGYRNSYFEPQAAS